MPLVFFSALLLLELILQFFQLLFLLALFLTALHFVLFTLLLQRLLRSGPSARFGQMPSGIPLRLFVICCSLPFFSNRYTGTKLQAFVLLQDQRIDFVVMRLSAKGYFAHGISIVIRPFHYTAPEWLLEKHGHSCACCLVHSHPSTHRMNKERTTREGQVTYPAQCRTAGLPTGSGASFGCTLRFYLCCLYQYFNSIS